MTRKVLMRKVPGCNSGQCSMVVSHHSSDPTRYLSKQNLPSLKYFQDHSDVDMLHNCIKVEPYPSSAKLTSISDRCFTETPAHKMPSRSNSISNVPSPWLFGHGSQQLSWRKIFKINPIILAEQKVTSNVMERNAEIEEKKKDLKKESSSIHTDEVLDEDKEIEVPSSTHKSEMPEEGIDSNGSNFDKNFAEESVRPRLTSSSSRHKELEKKNQRQAINPAMRQRSDSMAKYMMYLEDNSAGTCSEAKLYDDPVKILDIRQREQHMPEYLVRWRSLSLEDATWETSVFMMNYKSLIDEFSSRTCRC